MLEIMGKGRKELTNKINYKRGEMLRMQCLRSGWIISNNDRRRLDEICDEPRLGGVRQGVIGGYY